MVICFVLQLNSSSIDIHTWHDDTLDNPEEKITPIVEFVSCLFDG